MWSTKKAVTFGKDQYKAVNSVGKTGECYFTITPTAETGKIFSDQTGRFTATSSKGNKYMMIMYDYNSNSIWVKL